MEAFDDPAIKNHAEHMWKFLDELHKEDPEEYKRFIEKKKKEANAAKEAKNKKMFYPEPSFAIHTMQTDTKDAFMYFLNICSHPEVPVIQLANGTPAGPNEQTGKCVIPLSVGTAKDDKHECKTVKVCDVVFHPETVERCERDMHFKLMTLELALQHAEEDFGIKLHRAYRFCDFKYKGKLPTPQMTEKGLEEERTKAQAKKRGKGGKGGKAGPATQKKEIIMPFGNAAPVEEEKAGIQELLLRKPDAPSKKPLIQEISPDPPKPKPGPKKTKPTVPTPTTTTTTTAATTSQTTPKYSVAVKEGRLTVTIQMPLAAGMVGVNLDITPKELHLDGQGYCLQVRFPCAIQDEEAAAKFSKKKKTLTVSAPLL